MKKSFLILHSLGADQVDAHTASEALKKAFVPRGFRDALAVIDAAYVANAREFAGLGAPFVGFVGQPVTGGKPR